MTRPDPQALVKGLQAFQQGRALREGGRLAEAAQAYAVAMRLCPAHTAIWEECGEFADSQEDWRSSERIHRHLVQHAPGNTLYRRKLGAAIYKQQRPAEALPLAEDVARLRPDDPSAQLLLVACLCESGQVEAALARVRQTWESTGHPLAMLWLLICLHKLRDLDGLNAIVPVAMHQFPDDTHIRSLCAQHILLAGDYARGFNELDVMTLKPEIGRRAINAMPCPPWDGNRFDGTLLVAAEQGLGDEIMASSMYGDIAAMGQPAVIECDPRLLPIFARAFPALQFVPRQAGHLQRLVADGGHFRKVFSTNLPAFLRRQAAWCNPAAWLVADPARVSDIRGRYRKRFGDRLCTGVAWKSRRDFPGGTKSVELSAFTPLLAHPRLACVNLQYGDIDADVASLGPLADALYRDPAIDTTNDMEALFAQVAALDVVVTTSNSTAHVAGALGKRCLLLLPMRWPVLWYWGYEGRESPWYPSVRILRNPVETGWEQAMDQVLAELLAPGAIG